MASLDKLPKAGKVRKYKKLLFWAQGGVICIEDTSKEGAFKTETRAEFAARVLMIRAALEADVYKFADERNADWNFIVDGSAAVKEGRKQGDPFDPRVLEQLLKHRRRSFVYTGAGHATVVFSNVAGVLHDNPGSPAVQEAMAQNALLPPIPTAPPDKPITPMD